MRSFIGMMLMFSAVSAWSATFPHRMAPVPPISVEEHEIPSSAKSNVSSGQVVAAAMKAPVKVMVVGCKLTIEQVQQQAATAFDAFGAVGVRIDLQYVGGYDGLLCEPAFAESNTMTALENITLLFNQAEGWRRWRASAGADIVVLLRPYAPNADQCGTAWQNNNLDAGYAFAVVDASACDNDPHVMAHELGHLFGAAHGPKTDDIKGIYRFSNAFDGMNRKGEWLHTLMSYGFSGSPLYPRFSGPGKTRKSGRFNNGRTIKLTAPVVAKFR